MQEQTFSQRSKKRWPLRVLWLLLIFLTGLIFWDYSIQKNFDVVVPGKIYRSGQPHEEQLEGWIKKYNLKTIISFRNNLPEYEKELALKHNIRLHQVPLSSRTPPAELEWQWIRSILIQEKNLPLLIHCQSGADRTGVITALYRLKFQDWPLWKTFLEMNRHYHLYFYSPSLQRWLYKHAGAEDF